jgi:hypothetical protein
VNKACDDLAKIESGGRCTRPVTISIQNQPGEHFDSISVVHKGLGLKISMKKIEL